MTKNTPRIFISKVVPIHISYSAVNDGLINRL